MSGNDYPDLRANLDRVTDDQDVEELTTILVNARPDVLIAGAMLQRVAVAAARRVLASEWLARRDDRIRREAWDEGNLAAVSAPANRALGLGDPTNPYRGEA